MVWKKKTYYEVKPEIAINWSYLQTLRRLRKLVGKTNLQKALDIKTQYPSPLADNINSDWIKHTKIIGINPRIAGSYFNIVKYALTFPEESIHIMPVWEAGCDGSIYARVNWKLSEEWLDKELIKYGYKTAEEQLKLVVNLLHVMGKNVGFDAVGHTDKFSEEVFVIPESFEWIKLNPKRTKQEYFNDSEAVYPLLKKCITEYLREHNCSDGSIYNFDEEFFWKNTSFEKRVHILFGEDLSTRTARRIELMNYVRKKGFETIPVTEHCPCRPVKFEKIVKTTDSDYAEFIVPNKADNAKIFNSITPYRWYKIDKNGFPDINNPIEETFNYFSERVSDFQKEFNFDFFRGDMAHNQISQSHSSPQKDDNFNKEMWHLVKQNIQERVPYFGTFAEAFFNEYYIDGSKDLENKNFDIALGYSNFLFLDNRFIETIKLYHQMSEKYNFSPCITSITNDSDQPENNKFHQSPLANELRYFVQMFLTLPGYTGMGFEKRNLIPVEDCEYSGCYTNYQPKKYKWGCNAILFNAITRIRKAYDKLNIKKYSYSSFMQTPDEKVLIWTVGDSNSPKYICIVNLNSNIKERNINYELDSSILLCGKNLVPVFSLKEKVLFLKTLKAAQGCIDNVKFGDARIYKIEKSGIKEFNKKNNKQILLVTTECYPYAKSGGLADYCADFSSAIKQKYNTDIRVIMPLYNSDSASFDEGNSYIELFSKNNPLRYEICKTGIKVNYNWGIFDSYAELYKIKNPINNVIVYLVYSPDFSKMPKEYYGNMIGFSAAYTASVCAILKSLKNSKEKFNPNTVVTQDYLTANLIALIRKKSIEDKFFENFKTIHLIHNIAVVGEISTFLAFSLFFSRSEIDNICQHHDMREILDILKVQFKIPDSESRIEVLKYIYCNMSTLEKSNNEFLQIFFNILKTLLYYKIPDRFYNITEKALECCNNWVTVSECMYKELINHKYKSFLGDYFKKYQKKGCGILSGLNPQLYNPEDNSQIEFPYNKTNFENGKAKNKKHLLSKFSEPQQNSNIYGYLNNNNSLLLVYAARAEVTKGFDIIKAILPELFNKYKNVQVIIAGERIYDKDKIYFKTPEIKKLLCSGNLLVINEFININRYLAAADFLLTPSYFETCGLSVMQALRFGTAPISSLTGCVDSVIISPGESLEKSNGFKTESSLFENPKDIELYKSILFQAIDIYIKEPDLKNKIISNAMEYDSSWNEEKLSLYNKIFKELQE